MQLLFVFPGEAAQALLAPVLLHGGLVALLELGRPHDFAIHFQHDVPAAADDVGDLPVGHPADERDRDDKEDGLRDGAH